MPKRVWLAGALCSVLPDVDVVGFHLGIRCGDFWGHRGFTHSFLSLLRIWTYSFLATASHGFLDAMTGASRRSLLPSFRNVRYFFPWRPIRVSPIGISRFFTERGLDVLASELLWICPLRAASRFGVFWHRHRAATA